MISDDIMLIIVRIFTNKETVVASVEEDLKKKVEIKSLKGTKQSKTMQRMLSKHEDQCNGTACTAVVEVNIINHGHQAKWKDMETIGQ